MTDYEHLFEASYERVVGQGVGISEKGRTFFTRFYQNFFDNSEEVRDKFRDTDMEVQVGVLQKSMYHMVSFYVVKTESEYLSNVGRTHNRQHYNIRPDLYDHWLEALIETVRQLDPEFDQNVELAWRIAMSPGILYLKSRFES